MTVGGVHRGTRVHRHLLVLLLGIFPASLMALCYQAIRLTLAS
mgnify:CR=1 FL=1